MKKKGNGVNRRTANPHSGHSAPFAGTAIIQFGIFCCAITMVIVLAVALAAS